jgi:hypothetical protein
MRTFSGSGWEKSIRTLRGGTGQYEGKEQEIQRKGKKRSIKEERSRKGERKRRKKTKKRITSKYGT